MKTLTQVCLAAFCGFGTLAIVGCTSDVGELPVSADGQIDVVAAVLANDIETTKITGGGWLPSTTGDGSKANLGFVMNTCDPANVKGHFNYHDLSYTPSLKAAAKIDGFYQPRVGQCLLSDGTGTTDLAVTCSGPTQALVVFDYESKNKKEDAAGVGQACVCMDSATFNMQIAFIDGPYAGYSNEGSVKGNINNHGCDEDQS